jgi:hypothetical protein
VTGSKKKNKGRRTLHFTALPEEEEELYTSPPCQEGHEQQP